MVKWLTCTHCDLKHAKRADALCPRCRESDPDVADEAGGAGRAGARPARPAVSPARVPTRRIEDSGEVPISYRIAGAVLVANGALTLLALKRMHDAGALKGGNFGSAFVFDVIIGLSLLVGSVKLRKWAIFRAVVGGVVFAILFATRSESTYVVAQVVFSGAMLGLLVGTPQLMRATASTVAAAVIVAMTATGKLGGSAPDPTAALLASGEIQPIAGKEVRGESADYNLDVPGPGWYLRSSEATHRDLPDADRWLIRPDVDAHIVVIAEEVGPGQKVNLERYTEAVIDSQRQAVKGFEVLDREQVGPVHVALRAKGVTSNQAVDYWIGLYALGNRAFQVLAFAPAEGFPTHSEELRNALRTFGIGSGRAVSP